MRVCKLSTSVPARIPARVDAVSPQLKHVSSQLREYTGETIECPWCSAFGEHRMHEVYLSKWGNKGKATRKGFLCPRIGTVCHPSNIAQDTLQKLCINGKCTEPPRPIPIPCVVPEPDEVEVSDESLSRLAEVIEHGKG